VDFNEYLTTILVRERLAEARAAAERAALARELGTSPWDAIARVAGRPIVREWAAFALLALLFGSAFFWIKLAVRELPPFTLVALRLSIAGVGLAVAMRLSGQRVSRAPRVLAAYGVMAVLNTALPFTLIAWGQAGVDSALAAILVGTMPLFTVLVAHVWLDDERMTVPRVVGLLVGFVGVVVLLGREAGSGARPEGVLAILAASACYAAAAAFARKRLREEPPLAQATMVVVIAAGLSWLGVVAVERPLVVPLSPVTWLAVTWLGLAGSFLAYLLYFGLLAVWDATRVSVVQYVAPVIGVVLGVVVLGEAADWRLLTSGALVLTAIPIVHLGRHVSSPRIFPIARRDDGRRRRPVSRAAQASP
jgi:drug/metabolite transporter (DMT)-like permease